MCIYICCRTDCSCGMFKFAGTHAVTWGRDGGSEHIGGTGDLLATTNDFSGFVLLLGLCEHDTRDIF